MPSRALKIKYADLQLKPICWETNEGELVKVTFQPCLTVPINYYILKKLFFLRHCASLLAVTMSANERCITMLTSAKAVAELRVNVLMAVDVAWRSYYLKTESFQVN